MGTEMGELRVSEFQERIYKDAAEGSTDPTTKRTAPDSWVRNTEAR